MHLELRKSIRKLVFILIHTTNSIFNFMKIPQRVCVFCSVWKMEGELFYTSFNFYLSGYRLCTEGIFFFSCAMPKEISEFTQFGLLEERRVQI